MDYSLLLNLAVVIFSAKLLGLLAKRFGIPQVVGEIVAGLLIGPNLLNIVQPNDFLSNMAELGVIMLMFVAGLETDLKEIKQSGLTSLFVAAMGVLLPLGGGYLLYCTMYGFGGKTLAEGLFIGTIITATSVGITVEVLREIGKLKTKVGTVILSAAIIDDVIGIVLLSFVSGLKDTSVKPIAVIIKTLLFFVCCAVVGFGLYKLFKFLDKRWPHRRRLPIFGLAVCFVLSYCAEKFFGIADITGAYIAGVIFCNIKDADYIAKKVDVNSYMLFSPIFFASIGIKNSLSGVNGKLLIFSLLFVLTALVCKVLGCSFAAKLSGFKLKNSLQVGVGMMARGEVALIVAQKGINANVIESGFFAAVILLIMVSSVITPVILRFLYKGETENDM